MDQNSRREAAATALKKWCDNKPIVLGLFATQVALAGEAVFQLLRSCRKESGIFGATRSRKYDDWLAFYNDHHRVRHGVLAAPGLDADTVIGCDEFLRSLSMLGKSDKLQLRAELGSMSKAELRDEFSQAAAFWKGVWADQWAEVGGEFDRYESEDEWLEFLSVPSVRFKFCVAFPCWIFHGKWPGEMLRIASQGGARGLRALKDLVRLDNCVLHHPRLHSIIHPNDRKLKASRRALVASSLNGRPPAMSRTKVRYRLGRLISEVAARIGAPIKTPQIYELFAIAARIEPAEEEEAAREIQPGSFLKGIGRSSSEWGLGPKPDISSLKAVRALRDALS